MQLTRRTIDSIYAKIAKGGIQSELDLLLQGLSWVEITALRVQVEQRLRIGRAGAHLAEVEGIPVWGDAGWYIFPIDFSKVTEERFRTGIITGGHRKQLYDLSRQISVNLYSSVKQRYLELTELREEIAVAKQLLAEINP